MVRYFVRDAALPVTWLLLHTPVTANQVTFLSLIIGVLGSLLLALSGPLAFFGGVFLLQLWYLLDHVDGQIARYRQTASLSGRFYDFIVHHVIHAMVVLNLGLYNFFRGGNSLLLYMVFFVTLFVIIFNLAEDAKCKTFCERLIEKRQQGHLPNKSAQPAGVVSSSSAPHRGTHLRFLKCAYSFLHKLIEIHVLMNLLSLGAILEVLGWPGWNFRSLFFFFYGLVIPVVTLTRLYYWIVHRVIDRDFAVYLEGET